MSEMSNGELLPIKEDFTKKYDILRSDKQFNIGNRWSNEWLLSQYVKNTDGLIGKMDGSIPLKNKLGLIYVRNGNKLDEIEKDLPPPTSVIYLDKSARPIEWMTKALWPVLATPQQKGDEEIIPQRPKSYFLNIDKNRWLGEMGIIVSKREDVDSLDIDISNLKTDHIARIRGLFSTEKITEENIEESWNHPTIFDGQNIMIVDEVQSSGQTLNVAKILLSLAIPEATFNGHHWAIPPRIALNRGVEIDNKLQFQVGWVPVWYRDDKTHGRGVGNRDERWPEIAVKSGLPDSRVRRLGRHVLSTPYIGEKDEETKGTIQQDISANLLRKDISYLPEDLKNHNILYQPSRDRPNSTDEEADKYEERISKLNNISFQEWRVKQNKLDPNYNPRNSSK